MKKLRFVPFLGMLICISIFSTAQTPLFSDDFSNDLTNWTTSNILGSDVWHISGDDGIDGGKCARFYITSDPAEANNDWLVSPAINTSGISNITISFKYWYHDSGITPEFYYTNSYDGDVSTASWTQLDNSFWTHEWNWYDARFEIANPGENLVFAIRYQSTTELSNYILIDNFEVKESAPLDALTIRDIQGEGDVSPYDGQVVKTSGKITGINEFGCFIQDATDMRSGIFLYSPGIDQRFVQGTNIRLIATVLEYNGRTELTTPEWIDITDETFYLSLSYIEASQVGEDYEGVFVAIDKLTVVSQNEYQEFTTVSDQGDTVIIDNYLYQPEMEIGSSYKVYGIVDYMYNSFRVNPRAAGGINKLPEVTFQVDMQNETVSADGVYVNGDWGDWGQPVKMTDQGNSIYTAVVTLNPGQEYQYGYVNGGAFEWSRYENFQGPCVDEYSSRSITTSSTDTVIGVTCYNSCDACIDHNLPVDLPFTDDFSNNLDNWISQNTMGADVWHISGDDGIDGSQCARFYISSDPVEANDDWLISPIFNTTGLSNVAISFKYWYHGSGIVPEFYYTNAYSGDVSTTSWTQLDNSFWTREWNWYDARFEIANPGENLVFAIRYQSTTELSNYILIDNVEVKESAPLDAMTIRDIQGEGDVSPYDGQVVKTSGKITGINEFGCFIQDATDIRSGIFLYSPGIDQRFVQGTNIQLIATVLEYNGRTELTTPEWIDITDESFYISLPHIEASQVGEDYEGVFIAIDKLTVVSQNEYQEYITVSDQGDTVIIDNYLYQPEMVIGSAYKVYGIVDYMYNSFRVNPRAAGGINKLPEITFTVDMQNETVSSDGVFLNGDWNNWETPVQMTTDGTVYRATVQLTPGETYQYKFLNGLLESPDNYEIISDGGCTNTSSGNRELTPESGDSILPVVCFGSCSECEILPDLINVTFQVNMQNETVSDNGVYVNGDWEDWGQPVKMTDQGNSIYAAVVQLYPNKEYLYAFANGDPLEWDKYENFSGPCSDEYSNHILTTPANDTVLSPSCFNSCSDCINIDEYEQLTIQEIQGEGDVSPYEGQMVRIRGRITGINEYGCYMQDTTGVRSGIFLFSPGIDQQFTQGTNIQLIATVTEYNGRTELLDPVWIDYYNDNIYVSLPYVEPSAINEDYECVFIAIKKLTVLSENDYQEYITISDQGDTVIIDNYLYQPEMEIGSSYKIYGIVDYMYNSFRVNPRAAGGINKLPDITFSVDMQNETVSSDGVFLNGDWDNWEKPIQLTNVGSVYSTTIALTPGITYQYMFLNGTSETSDNYETISDGECVNSDSGNREITPESGDSILPVVCFGSCSSCGSSSQTIAVTFQVDMQNEEVSNDGVYINGSWSEWQQAESMEANGSMYVVTLELTPNDTITYKFTNGDATNWDNYETPAGDCSVGATNDRQIVVPDTDITLNAVCFNSCSACIPIEDYINVTFQVDMQNEEISEDGVFVNGSWSNWTTPVQLVADGSIYEATVAFPPGENIQYKFINGLSSNPGTYENIYTGDCIDSESGNRQLTVGLNDTILGVRCFGSCAACDPIIQTVGITFLLDMQNELVSDSGVYVMGSWDDWQEPIKMTDDGTSIFWVVAQIPQMGTYEYSFINGDGSNSSNYEQLTGPCANSSSNRTLTVLAEDIILDLVCFGRCVRCETNTAPMAFDSNIQLSEDDSTGFFLNGFDEEDQLDSLTFELVSEPQHAKVFTQTGRAINFEPELNYFENDQFQFVVKDTEGNTSEIATINIAIEPVNDRPEALPLEIDAQGKTQIEFDLANYISDVESDDSELTIKFVPENGNGGESILGGTITLLGGTRYLFETTDPISSEDFIVFRVSDEELTSFSQVITISNLTGTKSQLLTQENILTVNDTTDISFNHSVNLEFLGIDLALPFEQLEITVLQQPTLGVLSNFGINQYNGNILTSFKGTYSCTSNTEALDSIVFEVSSSTETIVGVHYLTTHAVKIAPKLQTIEAQKINEDESLQLAIQVTDLDTDLESLQWELVSTPLIGLSYVVEIENNVPQLKITPPENYFGNSVLKLIVSDNDQLSDVMSFPLTVMNQNDLPEIQFDTSISTYEDDPFSYVLRANDADKDSLFYSFTSLPDWLTAERVSKYTYELSGTPENKDVDETSVTITVSDYHSQVDQLVTIQVINVDDPPYLISSIDTVFLKTDESVSNLSLSDYFADDDPGAELNYSVTLNSNPEVVSTNILQDDAKLEITPAGVGTSSLSIEGTSDGKSVLLNFVVKVEVPTAVADLKQNIQFEVYPNPARDILHVKVVSAESKWRLEVFNLHGQRLYYKMVIGQEHSIDAKRVFKKAGNYLIKETTSNHSQVKMITVL